MRFAEMTASEIRQIDRQRIVVVAPIAACEQHSEHLAVITDTLLVNAVAEAAERQIPEEMLLLPTLWLGASHHHLRFGGTLSARVEIHVAIICEILTSVLEDGFTRVFVLNGHGGNIDTMHVALRSLQPRFRDRILAASSYWDIAQHELAALAEGPRKLMGHACEFETSMMLAIRPDLVRRNLVRNDIESETPELRGLFLADDMRQRTNHGAVGYSELASPEKGQRMIDAAAQRVTEVVRTLLRRPLPK
jgi:creatinine amidohydrolase